IPPPARSTLFPYTTLFRSRSATATFGHALTVNLAGGGGGTVSSTHTPNPPAAVPGEISCTTATCSAAFAYNSVVTLTATPSSGRSEEHTSELQSLAYLVCR